MQARHLLAALCAAALGACSTPAAGPIDAGNTGGPDAACARPCGTDCCTGDNTCNLSTSKCEKPGACVPACTGKACGSDGCGGSCGTCATGLSCSNGTCGTTCTPSCNGKACGSDGCGGQCGTCLAGTACNEITSACEACTPVCTGKFCGSDSCGGSCGSCGANETCNAGACVAGGADGGSGSDGGSSGTDSGTPDTGSTTGDAGTVPAANDTCASPQTLTFTNNTVTVTGTTAGGTDDYQSTCGGYGSDVVYTFTTTAVQNISVVLNSKVATGYTPYVYVRKACTSAASADELGCKAGTSGATGTAAVNLLRVPAGTYFVIADGSSGTKGAFELILTLTTPSPAPANDTCSAPTPLTLTTAGTATITGDTTDATADTTGSCSSFGTAGADLFYSFTLTAPKQVQVKVTRDATSTSYSPSVYIRAVCASTATTDESACATASAGVATASAPSLAAGTYFVVVDGSTTPGKFTLDLTTSAPIAVPTNDYCTSPQALTLSGGTVTVSSDSTYVKNDTSGTCAGTGPDLVFSITTTATQNITATVTPKATATTFTPVVYIRKVCTSSMSADELACKAGATAGGAATVTAKAVAAGTYFVIVDGYSSSKGAFDLTVTTSAPPTPPANDTCATAAALTFTAGKATATADTGGALNDTAGTGSCATAAGGDAFYSFTTTATQSLKVLVTGATGYSPVIYLRATTCSSTVATDQKACGVATGTAASFNVNALPAGSYFLVVDSATAGSGGSFTLDATLAAPLLPPANDTCTTPTALTITNNAFTLTGTTLASNQDTTGTCGGGTGPDQVYSFTTTAVKDFSATITPVSSPTFNAVIYLRKVCSSATSTDELGCSGGNGGGVATTLAIDGLPAGTYFLWVDGFSGTSGDFKLDGTLTTPPPPPSNDTCTTPTTLVKGAAAVSGTTKGATNDYGVAPFAAACTADVGPPIDGKDVVYLYKPTASGSATITVTPTTTTYDVMVWAGTGSCGVGASCVGAADQGFAGAPETLTFTVTANTTYYIIVDGYGTDAGAFTIKVQ